LRSVLRLVIVPEIGADGAIPDGLPAPRAAMADGAVQTAGDCLAQWSGQLPLNLIHAPAHHLPRCLFGPVGQNASQRRQRCHRIHVWLGGFEHPRLTELLPQFQPFPRFCPHDPNHGTREAGADIAEPWGRVGRRRPQAAVPFPRSCPVLLDAQEMGQELQHSRHGRRINLSLCSEGVLDAGAPAGLPGMRITSASAMAASPRRYPASIWSPTHPRVAREHRL